MSTIRHSYDSWSATYDSDPNLTRDLDEKVTRNALAAQHFTSIIEIGCGTGKNTRFLAQIGQRVLAIDFSAAMLAKAKNKIHQAQVTFALADIVEPWPAEDRSADLVVCNLVLEHIEDLEVIFRQARRVLIPGGFFLICELHPFRQYQGVKARFESENTTTEIGAVIHHINDFIRAAKSNNFSIDNLGEWWHEADTGKVPRLVSFLFINR